MANGIGTVHGTDTYSDATARPGVRVCFSLHRPGRPRQADPRGEVHASTILSEAALTEFRANLELHTPSTQKGRIQIYAGTECLTPTRVDASATSALAPLEEEDEATMLERQIAERRELLALIRRDLEQARQDRTGLAAEIERLRTERLAEVERTAKMVEVVTGNASKVMAQRTDDMRGRLKECEALEIKAQELLENGMKSYSLALGQLGEQAEAVVAARRRIDSTLRRDVVAESLGFLERMGAAWARTPAGDALAFQVAVWVAERTAKKEGRDFERDDALAAMMMNGRAFKERLQTLQHWCGLREGREARAVQLALQHLTGEVELGLLEAYVTGKT